MHAYLYPGVVLDPTALASNYSTLKLVCTRKILLNRLFRRFGHCPSFPQTPVTHNGCANRMDEGACTEVADRCEWWCGSKCVYRFETERLGHCGDQSGPSAWIEYSDPCNDACPAKFDPACGTDKITYANECLLKMVACRDDSWL